MASPNPVSSAPLPQQKAQLPNPFLMSDSQILEKVYLTHTYDDEVFDKQILYNVVSSVIIRSTEIVDNAVLKKQSSNGFIESRAPITDFKPEFHKLKLISCQMITIPSGVDYAHQTTMRILKELRTFSWDAKPLIALAAFSLDYGNFWYLSQIPTSDQLGNSLKQLNQIQSRQVPVIHINNLAKLVLEVVQQIKDWATWSAEGYDTEDVPALADALQEIPVVVYWAVASIVASTGNLELVGVSDYNLSDFSDRLSPVLNNLKKHINNCKLQIDEFSDYRRRKKAIKNPKDIVDFLKLLIHRNGSQNGLVYDGSTKNKLGIEVFKQKHVLLFISSLDNIGDEIRLLNSIYDRLQEDTKEEGFFRKEDFKILWIPIVDDWDNERNEVFNTLKSGVKWYAVEYFSCLPGIRLIREDLYYENKPIVPVVNPQGIVINQDAMDLIFEWGIDAFPFRKNEGEKLVKKWKPFWDEMKKIKRGLQIKGDRYIFIYGGTNNKWIQDFTLAVEKIERHETIRRADAIIEHYQVGKDDLPRFWIGIESKRQKKHCNTLDCEIEGIVNSLLCLKQDPHGWVVLSKGSNIKVLGHGEPMYQTVAEFESWKDKVLEKEGFDIAFKEYYESKVKDLPDPQPCAYMNIDNYASTPNVIATITCPNATCGRVMEVTSVNYRCCHSDVPSSAKV